MAAELRVAFAGGGTGGHLYPAVNLAKTFEKYYPVKCLFFGTPKGIETRKLPQMGYDLELINVRGFHRRLSMENFLFPFRLLSSLMKSKKILRQFGPHVVVGTGGYVMGPVLRQAVKLKVPAVIQEQNSFPGVTTRLLALSVNKVFIAYDEARQFLPANSELFTAGNPVNVPQKRSERKDACKLFELDKDMKTVLVFGGSQGAASINAAIQKIIVKGLWPDNVQLLWQSGTGQYETFKKWLESLQGQEHIHLVPYIDDMWSAYRAADLCICRAGAMSLSEISIAGLPAILVPLKSAAGNHQFKNAKTVTDHGAAVIVEDDEQLADKLIEETGKLIKNNAKRAEMSASMKQFAHPDAAEQIVKEVQKILMDLNKWPLPVEMAG